MQPPQYPYPPTQPPKRSAWQRFRTLGCGWQSLIGCMSICVLLFVGAICAVAVPSFAHGWNTADVTPTPVATASVVSQRIVTIVTNTPTTKPTHKTTATPSSATHGRPRMGGDISDFYGKYGTPSTAGNGKNVVWFLPDQTMIAATPDSINTVVGITIASADQWGQAKILAYCSPFLPDDAQEFNRVDGDPTLIDYHSSMGEIVNMVASNSCVISVSTS